MGMIQISVITVRIIMPGVVCVELEECAFKLLASNLTAKKVLVHDQGLDS